MELYFDWNSISEDATRSSRTEHIQASVVNQAINICDGKVFIRMEHTTQRGVMLTVDELRVILAEVKAHTKKK